MAGAGEGPAYYSKVGQQPAQVRRPIMRGSAETNVRGLDRFRGNYPCHNVQPNYIHFLIDNVQLSLLFMPHAFSIALPL